MIKIHILNLRSKLTKLHFLKKTFRNIKTNAFRPIAHLWFINIDI